MQNTPILEKYKENKLKFLNKIFLLNIITILIKKTKFLFEIFLKKFDEFLDFKRKTFSNKGNFKFFSKIVNLNNSSFL